MKTQLSFFGLAGVVLTLAGVVYDYLKADREKMELKEEIKKELKEELTVNSNESE